MQDTNTAPAVVDDIEIEETGQPAAVSAAAPAPASAPSVDPGDEDDGAEPVAAADPEASDAGKKLQSKRGSLQARIDAITKDKYDAERRAEAAERELQASRRPQPAERPAEVPRTKPSEDEIGEKYKSYGEYVEALADWKADQKLADYDSRQREHTARTQQAQRHEAHAAKFVEKIAKAEEADPKFWDKIHPDVANLNPSSVIEPRTMQGAVHAARQGDPAARAFLGRAAIADIIFDSESSTELMAHLSAHPNEIQRLSTLPPTVIAREMGKLEASVTRPAAAHSGPARVTPPVSQAAPPIKPVGSTASTPERDPLADDLDIDEHIRVMNAKEQKARRR